MDIIMDGFLKGLIFDDSPDDSPEVEQECKTFSNFFERALLEDALRKSGGVIVDRTWNEPIGVVGKQLPTIGTLAKRLGIVRSEIVEEDGERWLRGFNASGELVDARTLLPEVAE